MSFPRYPEYKDSGVDWLGEVPAHWDVRRARFLFEIRKRIAGALGYDVLSVTQSGIRIKDIESNDGQLSMDYSKYQIVGPGDFAMNHMDLLTGYVDISSLKGVTSPDYRVFSVRAAAAANARYLLYILQMGYQQKIFFAYGQGSSQLGRWRLPTEQFNDLRLPLPARREQDAIAAFLDRETGKIDALIAEQEKLIALLKEKRQALISHAVTKGLDPTAPMKDSGIEWLGQVPAHWDATTIRRVALRVDTGGTPVGVAPSDQIEDPTPWFTPGDFTGLLNLAGSARAIPRSIVKYGEAKCFPPGSTLIVSIGATLGKVGYAASECSANQQINAVVPANRLDGYFLAYSLTTQTDQMRFLSNASTIGIMNQEKTKGIMIAVPPREEQTEICRFLDGKLKQLESLECTIGRAIALLKERRAALISAAVTGKIDVRETSSSINIVEQLVMPESDDVEYDPQPSRKSLQRTSKR